MGPGRTPARSALSHSHFRVDRFEGSDAIVLTLHGEADLATAPGLTQALTEAAASEAPTVVLDATSLVFIDAHCLGLLAGSRSELRKRGRNLVVRSPRLFLRRLLAIVGLEALLEPAPTRVTAAV